MTKRKTPADKALDSQALGREALAASAAMSRTDYANGEVVMLSSSTKPGQKKSGTAKDLDDALRAAHDHDGPDEPIDWDTRDPCFVTKDEVIEHLIKFGRDSVPSRLAHQVLSSDDDDQPEPAKVPYIDLMTTDPTLFSVETVLEHIATHGLHSMSLRFIEAVMKRTYRDCEDEGIEDMSPGFLVSLALEAGKKANALNYVINMYSLTLESDLDKEAVGELCDQIERHLGDVIENVTELDRRLNLVEA